MIYVIDLAWVIDSAFIATKRRNVFAKFSPTSKLHFDKLAEKIERIEKSGVVRDTSQALIYLFLSSKFKLDEHTFYDCLTDGGNDLGVDAVYITRFGDRPEIHVVQSKYHTSERKAANPFKGSELKKFRDFLIVVKNRELDLSEVSNPILHQKILEIRELLKDSFPIFKLWCISNGARCLAREFDSFASDMLQYDAEVEEFHLSEFYNFCIAGRSKRTDHSFLTCGKEVVEFSGGSAKGLIGLISGQELFRLIQDITVPGTLDYGLFDQNIRGFLGSDNQINRQIYISAISEANGRFWCLNNGITMTCSRYEVRRMSSTPKVGAKELRIVNGAQTCGAVFRAFLDHSEQLDRFKDLVIGFRLFETNDPRFVEDIAISSNSQNRVNSRDLKANHRYQLAIEEELEKRGIRYLRKRGITEEYENVDDLEPSATSIDALKVGQILLSYIHQQPERAKRDSDAIFETLYEKIFSSIDFVELNFAIQLYRSIIQYRDYIEDEMRVRTFRPVEREFVTYGVFHVLFACRVLVLRDGSLRQNPDMLVSRAIALVESVVIAAGNPAYYTFFRSHQTAAKIEQHGMQRSLFD